MLLFFLGLLKHPWFFYLYIYKLYLQWPIFETDLVISFHSLWADVLHSFLPFFIVFFFFFFWDTIINFIRMHLIFLTFPQETGLLHQSTDWRSFCVNVGVSISASFFSFYNCYKWLFVIFNYCCCVVYMWYWCLFLYLLLCFESSRCLCISYNLLFIFWCLSFIFRSLLGFIFWYVF